MNLRRNTIFISILILSLLLLKATVINGQTVLEEVEKAFQTANASKLSAYFGNTLTINIQGSDIQCSREEARDKMNTFFADHQVKNFDVKFQGGKNNSNFLIGTLYTVKETYRVNLFFRKSDGENYIHLLRIDKEHGSEF
jgi:hypothetical protein